MKVTAIIERQASRKQDVEISFPAFFKYNLADDTGGSYENYTMIEERGRMHIMFIRDGVSCSFESTDCDVAKELGRLLFASNEVQIDAPEFYGFARRVKEMLFAIPQVADEIPVVLKKDQRCA